MDDLDPFPDRCIASSQIGNPKNGRGRRSAITSTFRCELPAGHEGERHQWTDPFLGEKAQVVWYAPTPRRADDFAGARNRYGLTSVR